MMGGGSLLLEGVSIMTGWYSRYAYKASTAVCAKVRGIRGEAGERGSYKMKGYQPSSSALGLCQSPLPTPPTCKMGIGHR